MSNKLSSSLELFAFITSILLLACLLSGCTGGPQVEVNSYKNVFNFPATVQADGGVLTVTSGETTGTGYPVSNIYTQDSSTDLDSTLSTVKEFSDILNPNVKLIP